MMLAYYACFIAMETDHILIISLVGAQLRKSDSTEYRLHSTSVIVHVTVDDFFAKDTHVT